MKKKINLQFLIMSVTAILLTLVISTLVSYEVLKDEVMADLRTYANVLIDTGAFSDMQHVPYDAKEDRLRVTVVAEDGSVAYDSNANASDMENHEKRPEIEQARKNGEGSAIRTSRTLDRSMFYYALRLDDGYVLRVAKESDNVFSIVSSTFPMLFGLAVVLFALGALFSHLLTKSIVAPIEQMANDMDHLESIWVYKELRPFITTIQKQHEDILKGAKMRQEFTANVSHELKTPLTSISGYAELIETGLAGENEVQRFASEIHRNAKRLLTLINDIIRLSELDADNMEVSFAPLNLYELAKGCVQSLKLNAANHDIEISCQGSDCTVNGNKDMLEELLYNLCDNAIRYNKPGGSVCVSIGMHGEHVLLTVKDTGIGIPEESQERVFERFYRVDKSRSKQTGGTGLGLAIVKHIVSQHHARLDLKSQVGVGTEVSVLF